MPYVIPARRVRGRWQVNSCPRCRRIHRPQALGLQTLHCGLSALVIAKGQPVSFTTRNA